MHVTTGIITQPSSLNNAPIFAANLYGHIELINNFGGKIKSRRNKNNKNDPKKYPKKDLKNNTRKTSRKSKRRV
jgi:hypothetical protein